MAITKLKVDLQKSWKANSKKTMKNKMRINNYV